MQFLPLMPLWALIPLGLVLASACLTAMFLRRGSFLDWLRRLAMVVCLILIAARPVTADESVTTERLNANVFFVVDRTGSMNAEDYNGSSPRLEGVKQDMTRILEMTTGSRYSIISFDSAAASQLPLTTDATAVTSWIDTLQTESTAMSSGSNVDRPLDVLTAEVTRAQEEDPNSHVFVYLFSDGENTDEEEPRSFAGLNQYVDAGAVLGYGTEAGGRMKVQGGAKDGTYIQDPSGGDGRSKIDETTLTRIADQMGVPYIHRDGSATDLTSTMNGIDLSPIPFEEAEMLPDYEDWYWIPAIILAIFATWELVAMTLRIPRRFDRADLPELMREYK